MGNCFRKSNETTDSRGTEIALQFTDQLSSFEEHRGGHSKWDVTVRTQKRKKDSALVCVSIDFGTTYSGYAYSFKSSPNNIIGRGKGHPIKTPTIVLLDPQKRMVAFGDDANRRYQNLVETNEHKRWYLFERFKMALFGRERPLDKDIIIKDILGKEMRAIDIFSNAIRFIKAEVMGTLTDQTKMGGLDIKSETDVHWVLTVPAIWDDLSKKFMRESATNAGIPDDLLTIALEPEAASLYCKEKLGITELPIGHRYIVLDLGGGTADITAHEVNPDGTLSEIHQPTGGDFGGTNVDNGFIGMLVQLFGAPQFKKLQQDCMDDYLDFMQSFESKKRLFDGSRNMIIRFPTHLKQIFASEVGDTVEALLDQTPFANQLEFKNDKLTVSVGLVKRWFDPSIINVVRCIQKLLEEVKPLTINYIFLVGGFSESPYVSSELQKRFGNMIRTPQDPSSAVLQGAVIYGHKPMAIAARVCKYTYGIARLMPFQAYHPASKKIRLGGVDYCDDIFNKHIEVGTKIRVADAENVEEQEYFPPISDMQHAVLEVYASPKKDPKYIDDDGCQRVGLIKVDIDPRGDRYSKILVKMMFGGTELRIKVTDVKRNIVTYANVDFLG